MKKEKIQNYTPFTAKMVWNEIAPHTWPAAILPVLIALALAISAQSLDSLTSHTMSLSVIWSLLFISLLMQSSVNVFNDYYDYAKGVDTKDNSVDPEDAVLVYNNINPKSALLLAISLLVAAFALGIYIVVVAGFIPLIIGIIGAVFVVIYSAGKTPLSYYPLGEFTSGFVMGGLITLASYYVFVGTLDFLVLVFSIPCIIGIGLIMMTNNTCDIEKDQSSKRRTLPALLGRTRSVRIFHSMLALWIGSIGILSVAHALFSAFTFVDEVGTFGVLEQALISGLIPFPFMLLTAYPTVKAFWRNPLVAHTRGSAMQQILTLNIVLGLFYTIALILPAAAVFWW